MFSVQTCVFCVCSGSLRAILPESVHVILTMLRVLLCVFVCVSVLWTIQRVFVYVLRTRVRISSR